MIFTKTIVLMDLNENLIISMNTRLKLNINVYGFLLHKNKKLMTNNDLDFYMFICEKKNIIYF